MRVNSVTVCEKSISRARARSIKSRMHKSNRSENSTGPSGPPCLVPLVVGNAAVGPAFRNLQ